MLAIAIELVMALFIGLSTWALLKGHYRIAYLNLYLFVVTWFIGLSVITGIGYFLVVGYMATVGFGIGYKIIKG